jgi:hypothetical protein
MYQLSSSKGPRVPQDHPREHPEASKTPSTALAALTKPPIFILFYFLGVITPEENHEKQFGSFSKTCEKHSFSERSQTC